MIKKRLYAGLSLLLFGTLSLCFFFKCNSPVITTVSIFTDYIDPSYSQSTAILQEALKTIDADCTHIFMNNFLWLQCIDQLDHKKFIDEWQVYDTQIGLLYLTRHIHAHDIGINTTKFKLIKDPFNICAIKNISQKNWPTMLDHLFNCNKWNTYHNNPESRVIFYMNGHGTQRTGNPTTELMCGINTSDFIHILTFLHEKIKITFMGIQSCFWPTARIYELMQKLGYNRSAFTILTPLSSEEGLWLETANNYKRKKGSCICFFDCCINFAQIYADKITPEITKLINSTDTLQLNDNKRQHATILSAGTQRVVTV